MSYGVEITTRAELEIDSACLWWAEHRSAEQAERWYVGIHDAIANLNENPTRRSLALENDAFPYELRELHFGVGRRTTHRVLFTVRDNMVLVLSVRHVAQQLLSPDDL
jgi:plasmid stabilization system protein ParE